ncbi:hypothetical protein C7T35_12415 [Variovorax sp. WS11]|nr:hypothetical protein C7T35_12415 [Variovorax sp. WS11]
MSIMLDKIEATLRESGYQGEPIAMYLAGGLAVNYYCGTRFTTDVDASFSRRVALNYRDLVVDFKDAAGKDSQIYFDTSYSPTLGPMHEDYEDDAIEWTGIGNERRLVKVMVLAPVDKLEFPSSGVGVRRRQWKAARKVGSPGEALSWRISGRGFPRWCSEPGAPRHRCPPIP